MTDYSFHDMVLGAVSMYVVLASEWLQISEAL